MLADSAYGTGDARNELNNADDDRWRIIVAYDHQVSRRLQQSADVPAVRAARQAVWRATAEEVAALMQFVGW